MKTDKYFEMGRAAFEAGLENFCLRDPAFNQEMPINLKYAQAWYKGYAEAAGIEYTEWKAPPPDPKYMKGE